MIQLWKNATSLEPHPAAYWPEQGQVVIIQLRDGEELRAVVGTISFDLDGESCTVEPVFIDTDDEIVSVFTPGQVFAWTPFEPTKHLH
ncbi:hypothetical protein [Ralstonia phage RP31]|uniref:Uncharacterized protein n=2 Tax=Ripduovirus RP12 TaxID=2560700 RepID=A0A1L7N0Y8_9CAUD|nr:hypothetical protein FDH28_gp258 [Ralstonia phage RP12]BAW19137.1 hypothetical protein [Ralstonia phage RP12]BAW19423.1 hypothetical protein [Ralstonia phage RP31]